MKEISYRKLVADEKIVGVCDSNLVPVCARCHEEISTLQEMAKKKEKRHGKR